MKNIIQQTREWYKNYYQEKKDFRNSLLYNPEVLFQLFAFRSSIISALKSIGSDSLSNKILDVGCGEGKNIYLFLELGFTPSNIYGVDILPEKIQVVKEKLPNINWICADASKMKFEDNKFDIVFESTMFIQLTNNNLSEKIAEEMIRVTKSGGYIILCDWRYSWLGNKNYNALTKKRIMKLFNVGTQMQVYRIHKGALIPPIGRFLSKYFSPLYFIISFLFPFLVGQTVTVLKKINKDKISNI